MGTSMKKFSETIDKLKANGIGYDTRLVNRNAMRRGEFGTFGENQDLAFEYYVYVHKGDYDNAYRIINKR